MEQPYQIDAFTDRVFAGNPAAVCPLIAGPRTTRWPPSPPRTPETVSAGDKGDVDFHLRWFTPMCMTLRSRDLASVIPPTPRCRPRGGDFPDPFRRVVGDA